MKAAGDNNAPGPRHMRDAAKTPLPRNAGRETLRVQVVERSALPSRPVADISALAAQSPMIAIAGQQYLPSFSKQPPTSLGFNLALAATAVEVVRELRLLSTRRPRVGIEGRAAWERLEKTRKKIKEAATRSRQHKTETREQCKNPYLITKNIDAIYRRLSQASTDETILANSWEQSMVAFAEIAHSENNPRVELVALKTAISQVGRTIFAEPTFFDEGSRSFLVIGRDPDTDTLNHASWNKRAVICDPVTNGAYSATELPKRMNAISGFNNGSMAIALMTFHPENSVFPLASDENQMPSTVAKQVTILQSRKFNSDCGSIWPF